jgi:hypothetical protein
MDIHIKTFKIDRVFDVVGDKLLSFEANGRREFGVRLDGAGRIRSGMTIGVALLDPDEWSTSVAWMDHASGNITAQDSDRAAVIDFALDALFVAVLIGASAPFLEIAALLALALGGLGLSWYFRGRAVRKARRMLSQSFAQRADV